MEKKIAAQVFGWQQRIPAEVILVAVSKEQPLEKVRAAYEAGQRHFGESRAQALHTRYQSLPKDIHWHMVGHLQRNKVRLIAPFVHLIQSVDSLRLLQQLETEGQQQNRLLRCLLQVHIATQDTHKYGLRPEELRAILDKSTLNSLQHVRIEGLMGMASHSTDKYLVQREFTQLQQQFKQLKQEIQHPRLHMKVLSMGMSSDYEEALSAGSHMLRIGSALFGPRPQKTP